MPEQLINFSSEPARERFIDQVRHLSGMFKVSIARHRRGRSLRQNAYYWAVVMPAICQGFAEAWGQQVGPDEAHELCPQWFLSRPLVDQATGEQMGVIPGHSSKLDVAEFQNYLERISRFAAERLGVVVPAADPTHGV